VRRSRPGVTLVLAGAGPAPGTTRGSVQRCALRCLTGLYAEQMTSEDPPVDELRDAALHEEIELVGDLVVAATSTEGRLSQEQIDRLLRSSPRAPGSP